jgi:RNA polymerase sigma factor (sigma-70 family)
MEAEASPNPADAVASPSWARYGNNRDSISGRARPDCPGCRLGFRPGWMHGPSTMGWAAVPAPLGRGSRVLRVIRAARGWNRGRSTSRTRLVRRVWRSHAAGGARTDDVTAVARAREGDLDAYGELVGRYTAAAHRTAVLLGAGDDAEDVVQEAFVKAFNGLAAFRADAPFRPWLLQIVANETMNLHRGRRRRAGLQLRLAAYDDPARAADPAEEAIGDDRRRALLHAVRQLARKDQLVITCRYFLELSEAETAQVLGWPAGSVKSRLSRALGRLRERLAVPLGEEVPGA